MAIVTVGIDLAKNVFALHATSNPTSTAPDSTTTFGRLE
jgi:hypothetical protein